MSVTAAAIIRTLNGAALALLLACMAAPAVRAEQRTRSGQALLDVDWKSPEVQAAASTRALDASGDGAKFAQVHLPVVGFSAIPQLVKNVAGPDPKPTEPRTVVVDPQHPYWYQITDTYDGITVAISADRRVNHAMGEDFQIGGRKSGAREALGTTEKPNVSILDSRTEEGMEGLIITYTLHMFPDIPYTVTIECAKRAVSQCKDVNVINKDEALLKVISAGAGS